MTSVGETLRRERLRRNLELDQISRELRISARFLEAIEAERFDLLPGTMFAKSFVRQYARLLDLNAEELASEVQRVSEPSQSTEPVRDAPKQVLEGIHVPRMDEWQSVEGRRFRWSSSLSALAGVVVVMLACSVIYTWWQRPRTVAVVAPSAPKPAVSAPGPAVAPPEAAPAPEGAAAPTPVTSAENKPADTPKPPAPAVSDASRAAPPSPAGSAAGNPNAPIRVALTADEPVWVLAREDGKYLFSGTLDANQTRTVEANGPLLLRFGNAGGVNVTFNGKNLGALGPKGQVRTIQFTSGGFQIVAAPKPSPADEDR